MLNSWISFISSIVLVLIKEQSISCLLPLTGKAVAVQEILINKHFIQHYNTFQRFNNADATLYGFIRCYRNYIKESLICVPFQPTLLILILYEIKLICQACHPSSIMLPGLWNQLSVFTIVYAISLLTEQTWCSTI